MVEKRRPKDRMAAKRRALEKRAEKRRREPQVSAWLSTWRRLLSETTFATLDELGTFLHEQGLHTGDIPSAEAFRLGIARNHKGKFFWHHAKCVRFLRRHDKLVGGDDEASPQRRAN